MKPFVILAMPRSRTAWLSRFLSYGSARCLHDAALDCPTVGDLWSLLATVNGTVETGAGFAWPLFLQRARVFVIRRPIEEVDVSLRRLGINLPADELEGRAAALDEASNQVGVKTVQYRALGDESVCAWLFEQCLGVAHDHSWWAALSGINVQLDMPTRFDKLWRNYHQIERLKAEARREIDA